MLQQNQLAKSYIPCSRLVDTSQWPLVQLLRSLSKWFSCRNCDIVRSLWIQIFCLPKTLKNNLSTQHYDQSLHETCSLLRPSFFKKVWTTSSKCTFWEEKVLTCQLYNFSKVSVLWSDSNSKTSHYYQPCHETSKHLIHGNTLDDLAEDIVPQYTGP